MSDHRFKHIVLSIYIHPQYYPPTLNAIRELSRRADKITIVTRNFVKGNLIFPKNVTVKMTGKSVTLMDSWEQGRLGNLITFIRYVLQFYETIRSAKPDMLVVHDPTALLAVWLIRKIHAIKSIIWYHNHDIINSSKLGRFSLNWLCYRYQIPAFAMIDVFTLPSIDRKIAFPLEGFEGCCFFLPNYPPKALYQENHIQHTLANDKVKLLYQGMIARGHGLEEIIPLLGQKISGRSLTLTLLGLVTVEYANALSKLAEQHNVSDNVVFLERQAYHTLPEISGGYDIGLAIHRVEGHIYSTGGTASNKIYEYAASGLPVILFDHEQYRKYLEKHNWAFFTDLTPNSIITCFSDILDNYSTLSKKAFSSFNSELNFEKQFENVYDQIIHENLSE